MNIVEVWERTIPQKSYQSTQALAFDEMREDVLRAVWRGGVDPAAPDHLGLRFHT